MSFVAIMRRKQLSDRRLRRDVVKRITSKVAFCNGGFRCNLQQLAGVKWTFLPEIRSAGFRISKLRAAQWWRETLLQFASGLMCFATIVGGETLSLQL